MALLTHRERVVRALGRQEVDRTPTDLGGTLATTIDTDAYWALRRYLGLPARMPVIWARRAQSVVVDVDVLDRFDVDLCPLLLGTPDRWHTRELGADTYEDEWHVTWSKPEGGHYLFTHSPFRGLEAPAPHDLERFPWPNPEDPGITRGLRDRAAALRRNTDRAIMLTLPVGVVHQGQYLRGFAEFLMDLVANKPFAAALMGRIADFWVCLSRRVLQEVGDLVDVVGFSDDLAYQRALLMSPATYREMIKPHHQRMLAELRAGTPACRFFHSCGAVAPLLEDLIDAGVQALNPVQVSATGMDTAALKAKFGDRLAFWGAVDTQQVLPDGSLDDVRLEVRRRVSELATGGGYVLAAVHTLQPDVPPANIAAMFAAAAG